MKKDFDIWHTTKQKAFDFYFNFTDPSDKKVSVILAQIRLVSVKRFIRDMYILPTGTYTQIKEALLKLLR